MELESLGKKELEDIYLECILKEKIIIEAKNLNHKIDDYIQNYMKKKIENKCIDEGFVKEDSINIIDKSIGIIKNSRFYGEVSYDVLYKAEICNPVPGNVIDCRVKFVNKLGLLGNNGPLVIIVGRQFHKSSEILDNINVDDIVKVKIIAKKFSINDNEIKVIAKLDNIEDFGNDNKDLTLGDLEEDDDDKSIDNNDSLFNEETTLDKDLEDEFDDDDMMDDLEDDDFDDELDDEENDKDLMINGLQDQEINEEDDLPDDEETLDEDDEY